MPLSDESGRTLVGANEKEQRVLDRVRAEYDAEEELKQQARERRREEKEEQERLRMEHEATRPRKETPQERVARVIAEGEAKEAVRRSALEEHLKAVDARLRMRRLRTTAIEVRRRHKVFQEAQKEPPRRKMYDDQAIAEVSAATVEVGINTERRNIIGERIPHPQV